MDTQQLKRLVREHYPFPIAHAHKKTVGILDSDLRKLKCLLETAEVTIQFLALLTLAQLRQDLIKYQNSPERHSAALRDLLQTGNLTDLIDLKSPSFGKWYGLTRDVLKYYRDIKDQLIVPELFDFWFQEPVLSQSKRSSKKKLVLQPLHTQVIEPLIALRNDFHHGRVPGNKVGENVAEGLGWLHQLLEALQFLAQYELSFTQRITLKQDARHHTSYIHDLTLFNGCLYETSRRQFEMYLQPSSVVLLHAREGKHLILNPFIIYTDYFKGPDIFLLNNVAKKKVIYVSSQFAGEELPTHDEEWREGTLHHETLSEFLDLLRNVPQASSLAPESADILSAPEAGEMSALPDEEEISPLSTTDVFQQRYQVAKRPVEHTSPYKFLDYYNPEDQDIFFGRDKEIRLLEQKFHTTRLLVLHGESGTGKTSLIRAGLIPRLSPEVYVPVYIRVLKEPLQEIKQELLRQLGLEDATSPERFSETFQGSPLELPLAELLRQVTERVSKTVIIVLDQFEEYFLRFPEQVRQQFEQELATCIETPRLDVKILISLRADYFSSLATFEDSIPQIFTHQVQLERLTEAQALEAVVKPAERLGIQVDEVMVQIKLLPELISEEGGPLSEHEASIEPPLLQIVCDALYQNAQSGGRQEIGMADYEAIGDVKGALGRYLEEKLRQFGKNQRVAKMVLKALVTAEGTKRASFLEELVSRVESMGVNLAENADKMSAFPGEVLKQKYLDKFVRHRLIRVEDVEGEARYELSHEYLVKHIEAWIKESEREVTKVLELIDRAYEAYQATGLLLENSALQMIKPFEHQLILPAEKQTFVTRSKTQVRKQRRGLLLKVASLLMFVAIIVGSIFGYQTYQQYQETIRQRDIAIAERQEAEEQRQKAEEQAIEALIQTSRALFLSHDELGALITGVRAVKQAKQTDIPVKLQKQAGFNLRGFLSGFREWNRLEGHGSAISCIDFSPDGTLLAESADRAIKFWNVADGREIRTLYGHSGDVRIVTFSPDGTLLASGSLDQTVKLWNVADGRELRTFQGGGYGPESLAFSPDGTILALGVMNPWGRTIIKLRNVADGKEIRTLRGDVGEVTSITFSPDGTLLASGIYDFSENNDGVIILWNVADGSVSNILHGHFSRVESIAFSPDGRLLASSSGSADATVKLWNVTDGSEIKTNKKIEGHRVTFSPDDTLLASGSRDEIKLWKITPFTKSFSSFGEPSPPPLRMTHDIREIGTLYGTGDSSITFSLDGTLFASAGGTTIKLWNVTGEPGVTILHGYSGRVESVTFSPDGAMLASSGGGEEAITLWNVADGKEISTLRERSKVESIAFGLIEIGEEMPGEQIFAFGNTDTSIEIWRLFGTKTRSLLHGHAGAVLSVAFSPDETLLASGSKDTTIKLWNWRDNSEMKTLYGHTASVRSVAFSPDGTMLVSGSEDKTVKLWRVVDGQEIVTLSEHAAPVHTVMLSPDGTLLASGSGDTTVRLWNVVEGRELSTLHGHSDAVHSMAFSPDGTLLASGSGDTTVKLWNVTDGREITTFHGHGSPVESLMFHPEGRLLVSGSRDGSVKLWNVAENKELATSYQHSGSVIDLVFDPEGKEFVSVSQDKVIAFWDIAGRRVYDKLLLEHSALAESLTFSPDGTLLASGSADSTIKLWNVQDSKEIADLPGHSQRVESVDFSADGRLLASGSIGIKLWNVLDGREIRTLRGKGDDVDFSADGRLLASEGSSATIELWNVAEGKKIRTLHGHAGAVTSLTLSPDDTLLASSGSWDETINLWNVIDGRKIRTLPGRRTWGARSLSFSPDSALLASASLDGTITLWNVADGKELATLHGDFRRVEFSPDGTRLVSGGWNGLIKLWDLNLENLVTYGCERLHSYLNTNPNVSDVDRLVCLDEEIAAYQKQIDAQPNHEDAWNNLGRAFQLQGKLDDAIAAFRKQVEVTPDHADAWNNIGVVLQAQGKLDKAIDAFQKQLESNPSHEMVWNNLGMVFQRQEKSNEAIDAFHKHGELMKKLGKLNKAIAVYQKQLEINPKHEDAWYQKGSLLQRQDKRDEALAAFQKQVEIMPDHEYAWHSMGDVFQKQDKWDEAFAAFQKHLEIKPDDQYVLHDLGLALMKQGRLEETITFSQKLFELNPESTNVFWYNLGKRLENISRDQAIVAYKKQVEVEPDHEDAWYKIGFILQQQEELDEAIAAYQKQVEVKPDHEEAWFALGGALIIQGDLEEAIAAFRKQVKLKPDDEWAWYLLGKALQKQDKFDEAIAAYQKQVESKPAHADAWFGMGSAFHEQGKLDEAITAYQEQVEITPDHESAWSYMGAALYEQNKLDEAIAALQKQVEITPDYADAWNMIGVVSWKQGNRDEAAKAFARALELKSKHLTFLHNDAKLALVQADIPRCQKRIATAIPLVKPDSHYYPLFPFYAWLANPEQGWEPVMTAIEQLEPEVNLFFITSTFEPFLKRQDEKTREITQHFIEFFQDKIDLPTLKARLAEGE